MELKDKAFKKVFINSYQKENVMKMNKYKAIKGVHKLMLDKIAASDMKSSLNTLAFVSASL